MKDIFFLHNIHVFFLEFSILNIKMMDGQNFNGQNFKYFDTNA